MPTARIEIEHVNKNWVIQVEASSILRSDRKTIYADTIEEAFASALSTYHEMEAKVRPQDEGKPRELTPELAEAVKRFKEVDEASLLIATPEEAADVRQVSIDEIREQFPSALAKAIKENVIDGPRLIVTPDAPKPLRGRHPKTCACDKCAAKRAA